ncbi:Kif18a protein, related [Neospora caninum Liverpool]|uniref:Kinesin-like protein n=1 Tax=Neospora caninum (strain Liverpool) TaxID=572307 RepID=F0VNY0_NEOCL|nr:Kif18a protein, related [Neospora caninum Liverpool]CBZ55426.1 Kif18a protein, related [Neospora caninum Liverpool]|eukprot:XP_003885454.1 Kif18a protein, related [Neospora caninum Liverpool]
MAALDGSVVSVLVRVRTPVDGSDRRRVISFRQAGPPKLAESDDSEPPAKGDELSLPSRASAAPHEEHQTTCAVVTLSQSAFGKGIGAAGQDGRDRCEPASRWGVRMPQDVEERKQGATKGAQKEILDRKGKCGKVHVFHVDGVLDEAATQEDAFRQAGLPAALAVLNGINASLIVFQCRATAVEIYCERLRDLLVAPAPRGPTLVLREDPQRGVLVAGLSERHVKSAEELLAVFHAALRRRRMRETPKNATSSRAHTVLSLHVETRTTTNDAAVTCCSSLHLVDLAGAERQTPQQEAPVSSVPSSSLWLSVAAVNEKRKEEKTLMEEACFINKSLSTLVAVIAEAASRRNHGEASSVSPRPPSFAPLGSASAPAQPSSISRHSWSLPSPTLSVLASSASVSSVSAPVPTSASTSSWAATSAALLSSTGSLQCWGQGTGSLASSLSSVCGDSAETIRQEPAAVSRQLQVPRDAGKQASLPRARDSKLTFLLKNALDGHARVILVATVSPLAVDFTATLATLQLTQKARRIRGTPVGHQEAVPRHAGFSPSLLEREIVRLRALLSRLQPSAPLHPPSPPFWSGSSLHLENAQRRLDTCCPACAPSLPPASEERRPEPEDNALSTACLSSVSALCTFDAEETTQRNPSSSLDASPLPSPSSSSLWKSDGAPDDPSVSALAAPRSSPFLATTPADSPPFAVSRFLFPSQKDRPEAGASADACEQGVAASDPDEEDRAAGENRGTEAASHRKRETQTQDGNGFRLHAVERFLLRGGGGSRGVSTPDSTTTEEREGRTAGGRKLLQGHEGRNRLSEVACDTLGGRKTLSEKAENSEEAAHRGGREGGAERGNRRAEVEGSEEGDEGAKLTMGPYRQNARWRRDKETSSSLVPLRTGRDQDECILRNGGETKSYRSTEREARRTGTLRRASKFACTAELTGEESGLGFLRFPPQLARVVQHLRRLKRERDRLSKRVQLLQSNAWAGIT